MLESARWTAATSLSTSNGEALINRYEQGGMPRVQPGKATPETREVLAINGPPVLSMERMVESDTSGNAAASTSDEEGEE